MTAGGCGGDGAETIGGDDGDGDGGCVRWC